MFKQENGPFKPSTSNTFSLGTSTSSKWIIPVSDAYNDILPSIEGASIPLIFSLSRTKPLIFLESVSLAQTTNILAIGELVIQFLAPFKIQLPSFYYLQVVYIPLGSEPTFGSVNPKQPMISPFIKSSK